MACVRKTFAVIALLFMLTACGREAGPKPKAPAPEPGPDALPTKLTALSVDQCFVAPKTEAPKGCEKYVTEVGNTTATVRKRVPEAGPAADAVDAAVKVFRTSLCKTTAAPCGACTQALVDMANALESVKTTVNRQATTG